MSEFQKQFRPFAENGQSPGLAANHVDRLECRSRVRRGAGGRKYECRRRVAEVADQPLGTRKIPSLRAERLADRTHPEIALAGIHAEEVTDAATLGPHRADGVGLVDVEQRIVLPLDLQKPGQIGVVAIHAVNTLDRDDHATVLRPQVAKQAIELLGVVVSKRPLAGLR